MLDVQTRGFWFFVSLFVSVLLAANPAAADDDGYVYGLMPKEETGALRFLKEHPEYDGRGVTVAIFDTGVDPGAAGLQTTPDGRPKVVDIVDATGSGDVDMSKVVKPVDGKVTGLSGRELTLNPKWKNPSGEVRIGMKAGYELFPQELVPRVKKHRRKEFMQEQRRLEQELREQIANYNKDESDVEKSELEKRLAALTAAGNSYKDAGPIYDCVVYHDGAMWRASVDTDEDGDFSDEKAMTNYRSFREWTTFDDVSLLNFGVNIYEDGKVLSIVADSHPHGTHVAGIVAAHWPGNPSLDGVAPGAQIVSVKIGDTYLDGMETGEALIRAGKSVLENKCDLINMSFGEPTKTPNKGIIIRYFSELVDKHGVIFCASAGNAGPALSTVGAPGGTSSSLIGIGAHVSPRMAAAQYALRAQGPDLPYTWTSRGPTFDGDIGVNLFAPGGAIAPVPQWTLDRVMQMNGTSMASPNCCGNFALVLSGLKAEEVPYNPVSVQRAFENTAAWIDAASPWAQGAGLIQTPDAYEELVRCQDAPSERLAFDVSVGSKRGIYLREPLESGDHAEPQEFRITVGPRFHPNATATEKVNFHQRLTLESTEDWVHVGEEITLAAAGELMSVLVDPRDLEPGAHFAEILGHDPDDPHRGPLFRIPVTVLRLLPSESEDHFEWIDEKIEIEHEDGDNDAEGEEVSIIETITGDEGVLSTGGRPQDVRRVLKLIEEIERAATDGDIETDVEFSSELSLEFGDGQSICPAVIDGHLEESLDLEPGRIERRFMAVPDGATWVDLHLAMDPHDDGGEHRMFMIHAVQAIPGWTNRDGEKNNFVVLEPGVPKVISFKVQPGRSMEVAFAQYWSSLGECDLHYELIFNGITPDQREVRLQPGDQAVRVEVSTPLHHEHITPSAKLTSSRRLVKPKSAVITQLAEDRDGFDENRRFSRLELSYDFEQSSAGSVTPRFSKTDDLLYDSEYGGTVWAIYEAGGRRVATDDIWPDAVSLGKGKYTLKLWVRHDTRSKLESLKSMQMALERPLGSPVTLPVYSTLVDAMNGGPAFRSTWIAPGEKQRLFVGNIKSAPAGALSGDVLLGTITYGEEGTHDGAGQRPGGFPVSVVVSPTAAPASASSGGSGGWTWQDPNPPTKTDDKLKAAIRDAKIEFLKSLSVDSQRKEFDKLAAELLKENKGHLPVLVARLQKLDDVKKRKERLQEVVDAADAVLAELDADEIAGAFGTRIPAGDKDAAKARKLAENRRDLLIDTLYRKGRALGYMELPEVLEKHPIKDQTAHDKAFEDTYAALSRWVDPASADHFLLHVRREARKGHLGEALKVLNQHSRGAAPNYWYLEKRRKFYDALGWKHLQDNQWRWRTLHFPGGKP